MSDEIKTELASREVIQGQLLAVLDDKAKVAITLSKDDCTSLIAALNCATTFLKNDGPVKKWAMEFARGVRNLKRQAFPEEG